MMGAGRVETRQESGSNPSTEEHHLRYTFLISADSCSKGFIFLEGGKKKEKKKKEIRLLCSLPYQRGTVCHSSDLSARSQSCPLWGQGRLITALTQDWWGC